MQGNIQVSGLTIRQIDDRRKSSVPVTSWKWKREGGDTTERQDRALTWMEQNVLKETQGQRHGCSACAVSSSPTSRRALGLIQCSAGHLEIYNNFVCELRSWSLLMSRQVHATCVSSIPHCPIPTECLECPRSSEFQCTPSVAVQWDSKWVQEKCVMKAGCFESLWTPEFPTPVSY